MEYGLGWEVVDLQAARLLVLILLLVEYSLGYMESVRDLDALGLNPSFCGI